MKTLRTLVLCLAALPSTSALAADDAFSARQTLNKTHVDKSVCNDSECMLEALNEKIADRVAKRDALNEELKVLRSQRAELKKLGRVAKLRELLKQVEAESTVVTK